MSLFIASGWGELRGRLRVDAGARHCVDRGSRLPLVWIQFCAALPMPPVSFPQRQSQTT